MTLAAATLLELERLEREATSAPWSCCHNGDCPCRMIWSKPSGVVVAVGIAAADEDYTCGEGITDPTMLRANAALIAALRNAAPDLLAAARERDELRAENERLAQRLEGAFATIATKAKNVADVLVNNIELQLRLRQAERLLRLAVDGETSDNLSPTRAIGEDVRAFLAAQESKLEGPGSAALAPEGSNRKRAGSIPAAAENMPATGPSSHDAPQAAAGEVCGECGHSVHGIAGCWDNEECACDEHPVDACARCGGRGHTPARWGSFPCTKCGTGRAHQPSVPEPHDAAACPRCRGRLDQHEPRRADGVCSLCVADDTWGPAAIVREPPASAGTVCAERGGAGWLYPNEAGDHATDQQHQCEACLGTGRAQRGGGR